MRQPATAMQRRVSKSQKRMVWQLTTQAQRPGARDATIATATFPPGSLQRMVRPRCHFGAPSVIPHGTNGITRANTVTQTRSTKTKKEYAATNYASGFRLTAKKSDGSGTA